MIPFEEWTQEERELYWKNLCARINSSSAFNRYSGITITKISLDYCEGVLEVGPNSGNTMGFVHGGCLATLADTVGGCAAASRGYSCVTLNCTYSYLRRALGEKIYCSAQPLRVGHQISNYYVTLRNDKDVVIGDGSFTYFLGPLHGPEIYPPRVLEAGDMPAVDNIGGDSY